MNLHEIPSVNEWLFHFRVNYPFNN